VLFVGLAAGAYSSIFLATPVLVSLKDREPEQQALRKRVLARRAAEARQGGVRTAAPVASARRARTVAGRGGGGATAVAVAERPGALPERPTADVPVESPDSVGPGLRPSGARTTAPRPGQRPQRGPGKKRR
jgi:preprotein translocase subunit SecF